MFDNIIDIHSHALWGLDDGSRNFGESMDMCFLAEDSGTSVLFVTPHLMYWDTAGNLFDRRNEKIAILNEHLENHNSELVLKPGFEILCDDDIFSVKHFYPYTLNNSRYILVEFSFSKTEEADAVAWCNYLKSFGLVPIIAHPERYNFVKDDICCLNRLSDNGVLFQINAGSLVGAFGSMEQAVSSQMLNCGFCDFIGSDAHRRNGRNTDIGSLLDVCAFDLNEEYLENTATLTAENILNDTSFVPLRKKYLNKL